MSRDITYVDPMGLEPTTSSMPWRRSTGLSYGPETDAHDTSDPRLRSPFNVQFGEHFA